MEIEAKIKLENGEKEEIETLLKAKGKFLGRYNEINRVYDLFGILKRSGKLLRLREERGKGKTKYILTYKGPQLKSKYKKRVEKEQIIKSCWGRAIKLWIPCKKYLKKRTIYKYLGTEVMLDTVKGLGEFVEIEGPDEKTIQNVMKSLRISKIPIKKSYTELLEEMNR